MIEVTRPKFKQNSVLKVQFFSTAGATLLITVTSEEAALDPDFLRRATADGVVRIISDKSGGLISDKSGGFQQALLLDIENVLDNAPDVTSVGYALQGSRPATKYNEI